MSGCLAADDIEVRRLVRYFRLGPLSVQRSLSTLSFPIEFAVCSIPCMCRR
jgi:hypothetical protein